MMTVHRGKVLARARNLLLTYLAVGIVTFFFIFPLLWMISTSVKPSNELFRPIPTLIPQNPTAEHYIHIWTKTTFPISLLNSFIVALSTTLITLLFSIFFAYGISRFHFRGKSFVLNLLLLTQMFPLSLLIITIFVVFARLSLLDSYAALVISHCTFAMPFAIIMLRSFFEDMPFELEEAAAIDGCTALKTIFKVIIPLSGPAIAAMGIYAFILSWQEYMMSMTLIRSEAMRTVPVLLSMMIGFMEVSWGPLMAGTTVITLPVVVVFVYFQKYMISGMTLGAVKG